jgi:hypothetical protein
MKRPLLALVTGAIALVSSATAASALEKLQLLFGQEFPPVTLSVNDLRRLANTGTPPQELEVIFTFADIDPRRIQTALNFELPVDQDQFQQSLSGSDRDLYLTLLSNSFGLTLSSDQQQQMSDNLLASSKRGKLSLVDLLTALPVDLYSVEAFALPVRARRSLLVLRRMGVNVDSGLTALGQTLPGSPKGLTP